MLTRTINTELTKITIAGNPTEVLLEVNRFNNFGIISKTTEHDFKLSGGIPSSYREGEDSFVVLNTYKKRFFSGLLALAATQVKTRVPLGKGFKRMRQYKTFQNITNLAIAIRAVRIFKSNFLKKNDNEY